MIQSLYQIDFITASGTRRLLDIGDLIETDIAPKVAQGADKYSAIGAAWGESQAQGGAMVDLGWSTVRTHASHAELRSFCMRHAASFPSGKTGTLRITISGGETWEISDATLLSSAPMPLVPAASFKTITAYQATGGRMLPVTAITLYSGIPWEFILQHWEAIAANNWEDL
jgi:hypothetical protein